MRWIASHPSLRLSIATSTSENGRSVADLYPALAAHVDDLVFTAPDLDAIATCSEVAILAVPHTAALGIVPALLDRGVRVIDLSADFRLTDAAAYEKWYGLPHTAAGLLAEAVYGLPELDRSRLPEARLVACPGCYPTATVLAALPALAGGLWDGSRILVDAKSGVTGAGRGVSAATHFVTVNESLAPYNVGVHRHTPEMEQVLSAAAGSSVPVLFAPHLVPMSRGLLATVYIGIAARVDADEVLAAYSDRYVAEPLVHLHEPGRMPTTAEVRGTARASLGIHFDSRTRTLVAACAIDNLGKGASSQAIQCLNVVFGLPETEGLLAVGPVV